MMVLIEMVDQNKQKLGFIIKQQAWLMNILRTVRDLELPDWYVAAGAIRNTVWNYLHDYPTTSNQQDVDVVYFSDASLEESADNKLDQILRQKLPQYKWEVFNQARGHLYKQEGNFVRPKVATSCESIAYWSETPTCIGVRLEKDDTLAICAPHGLDDLMSLHVRPVPLPFQNTDLYRKRQQQKKWDKIWPKLIIESI